MKQKYLGRGGALVSELCLGTMTFGREADEHGSRQILDRYADAGGMFIDTADVYSNGLSEEIVGRWLAEKKRDDFFLATKVRFAMGDEPNNVGLSRLHILNAVDQSLKRLKCDYIDLYQAHCWDYATPIAETLRAIYSLIQAGKVRYFGISNFKAYQIQKTIDISRHLGFEPPLTLQPLYNLLDRSLEWEIVELCESEGLGIIPWSPLRGGWLSGKYRPDMQTPPQGTRLAVAESEGWMERWSAYNSKRTWRVVNALHEVAEALGKSMAQVAINWLSSRPAVTAPIIGARTLEQLNDNLGSVGWEMPRALTKKLNDASALPMPYPYDFVAEQGGSRIRR